MRTIPSAIPSITIRVIPAKAARPTSTSCGILLDLHPQASPEKSPEDTSDLPNTDLFILDHALDALIALCNSALSAGYTLRIELPAGTHIPGSWPLYASRRPELRAGLHPIIFRAREPRTYPFAIWAYPHQEPMEPKRKPTIDFSQLFGMESMLFNDVLLRGGFRIAVSQSSFALSVSYDDLTTVYAWVKGAAEKIKVPVAWDTDF